MLPIAGNCVYICQYHQPNLYYQTQACCPRMKSLKSFSSYVHMYQSHMYLCSVCQLMSSDAWVHLYIFTEYLRKLEKTMPGVRTARLFTSLAPRPMEVFSLGTRLHMDMHTKVEASFPGHSHLQFLITCSLLTT